MIFEIGHGVAVPVLFLMPSIPVPFGPGAVDGWQDARHRCTHPES